MKKITILLTSAGVATCPNVISSLRKAKSFNFEIISVDIDKLAAGLYLSDKYFIVPRIDSPQYIEKIKKICQSNDVSIIIPLLSNEISLFSKHKDEFLNMGVRLAVSGPKTIEICQNKNEFINFLSEQGFITPKLYKADKLSDKNFPIFIKPVKGSSSRNAKIVNNKKELSIIENINNYSLQEYIKGPEYTIDTLCDLKGNYVAAVIRERLEIKDGKAVKCRTVMDGRLLNEVKKILSKIKIIGPANIQCIRQNNKYFFIEINTRFAAGGLPLSTYSGVNMPFLLVKLLLGLKINDSETKYNRNVYMSRYLTEVFPKIN